MENILDFLDKIEFTSYDTALIFLLRFLITIIVIVGSFVILCWFISKIINILCGRKKGIKKFDIFALILICIVSACVVNVYKFNVELKYISKNEQVYVIETVIQKIQPLDDASLYINHLENELSELKKGNDFNYNRLSYRTDLLNNKVFTTITNRLNNIFTNPHWYDRNLYIYKEQKYGNKLCDMSRNLRYAY